MMNSDNLSTLFGSLQNKSAFSGVNLSEYALIKKGAYGKALKAYYAEQKDEPVKVSGAKKPLKKTESKAAESISMVKKSADTLSSSLSKLSSDELWSEAGSDKGREKVTKSISDFVSSYNDVLTHSAKVNSTEVSNQKKLMNGMTSTMSKALAGIGITVKADGSLLLDEDKLNKSSINTVKGLFNGKTTYGSMIQGYSDSISKAMVNSATTYNGNGASVSNLAGLFETII